MQCGGQNSGCRNERITGGRAAIERAMERALLSRSVAGDHDEAIATSSLEAVSSAPTIGSTARRGGVSCCETHHAGVRLSSKADFKPNGVKLERRNFNDPQIANAPFGFALLCHGRVQLSGCRLRRSPASRTEGCLNSKPVAAGPAGHSDRIVSGWSRSARASCRDHKQASSPVCPHSRPEQSSFHRRHKANHRKCRPFGISTDHQGEPSRGIWRSCIQYPRFKPI